MTVQRLHVEKRFSEIAISGNLVHLAGQLATDLTLDIKGQTQQTLDMIDRFLADAGTDKSHIMSVMIFLKDIENDYAAMNVVWDAWCSDIEALPRTCVEAKLYRPDVLVEMTVVAVKPEPL
ncbi:RidA family protein [Acinetobacter bereziniae]|uniref:RidA family protein n=1 Tax=Acinetobacter bereziniae TaxID=106648 RepID=UPI0021E35ECD|nr:RidA family protein [Acinetobacter bereziniae]MCV2444365.1 RidA family protein [Acinetobacter bereziniae]